MPKYVKRVQLWKRADVSEYNFEVGPSFLAQNINVFYDFRKSLISPCRTIGFKIKDEVHSNSIIGETLNGFFWKLHEFFEIIFLHF